MTSSEYATCKYARGVAISARLFESDGPGRVLVTPPGRDRPERQADMRTVPLGGKKAAGRVALVDDADHDLVMQNRWRIEEDRRPDGSLRAVYARANTYRSGRKTTIRMHALLTAWPQTDHADHDGLNNQRANLRPATQFQNAGNQRKLVGKSSRYKGVSRQCRRWRASIKVDGKSRHLGLFACEEDAADAYDRAAREAFGNYAHLNQAVRP